MELFYYFGLGIFMTISFFTGFSIGLHVVKKDPKDKNIFEKIEEHKEKKHRKQIAKERDKELQEQLKKINEYNGL